MKALIRSPRRPTAWLPGLWLGLAMLVALAPAVPAQPTCSVTATPAAPVGGQPFSLCGPDGTDLGYNWFDNEGNWLGDGRCLAYPSGLAPGAYDWTLMISQGIFNTMCPFHLTISDSPPAPCDIAQSPAGELCFGQSFTLCGPEGEGLGYAWTDADNHALGQERCLAVPGVDAGNRVYRLTVTLGGASAACSVVVAARSCETRVLNCPRGAGFWSSQCVGKGKSPNRISSSDMVAIASQVDQRSAFFSWSESRGGSLCDALRPEKPMDARKRAKRQFASLLANVAAGQLGVTAGSNGPVALDPSTAISCTGLQSATVSEAIVEVDGLLSQFETQSLRSEAVRSAYNRIAECLRGINTGATIGEVCTETRASQISESAFEASESMAGLQLSGGPLGGGSRLTFDVPDGGQAVDLRVYDVAGRLVHRLAQGFLPAGRVQLTWNGTDDAGRRVPPGVFFVRGTVGAQPIAARLLVLR